jgi:hypothetical protein
MNALKEMSLITYKINKIKGKLKARTELKELNPSKRN